jgi:hypothetical protein
MPALLIGLCSVDAYSGCRRRREKSRKGVSDSYKTRRREDDGSGGSGFCSNHTLSASNPHGKKIQTKHLRLGLQPGSARQEWPAKATQLEGSIVPFAPFGCHAVALDQIVMYSAKYIVATTAVFGNRGLPVTGPLKLT